MKLLSVVPLQTGKQSQWLKGEKWPTTHTFISCTKQISACLPLPRFLVMLVFMFFQQ